MSLRSTSCRNHSNSHVCADAKPKRKDLKLRKRRKAKATALKLQAQLQADLREAEAGADPQQRRAAISATLEALLEITARVLKHAAANAALKGGKAGGLSLMRSPGASVCALGAFCSSAARQKLRVVPLCQRLLELGVSLRRRLTL